MLLNYYIIKVKNQLPLGGQGSIFKKCLFFDIMLVSFKSSQIPLDKKNTPNEKKKTMENLPLHASQYWQPHFWSCPHSLGGTQSRTRKSPILWLLRGTKQPMCPATAQCLQLNAAFKAHLLGASESFPEVMSTQRAGQTRTVLSSKMLLTLTSGFLCLQLGSVQSQQSSGQEAWSLMLA